MSILSLARPEILTMKPYSSARKEGPSGGILLNANESPWPLFNESSDLPSLNRYPDPQPAALLSGLSALYGVDEDQVLITRGSDEGIDLLTRVFCRAGLDAILQCTPTFGMYRIAAETQGAAVVSIPRLAVNDFSLETREVLDTVRQDDRIRLVFLTSPNNPTGDCIEIGFLEELLSLAKNRAIIVVDEAYAEFCDQPSAISLLDQYQNLVVLRTLSKAWACAGLRCGTVLAHPQVIDLLGRIIAPYPLASPVTALATQVLEPDMMLRQKKLLREIWENKRLLLDILANRPFILDNWPGEANFVLIRVTNAGAVTDYCAEQGIILRAYPNDPALKNCIRISVGSKQDLAALKTALDQWQEKWT
jgi:histidinol-phosphate aminotransferase